MKILSNINKIYLKNFIFLLLKNLFKKKKKFDVILIFLFNI